MRRSVAVVVALLVCGACRRPAAPVSARVGDTHAYPDRGAEAPTGDARARFEVGTATDAAQRLAEARAANDAFAALVWADRYFALAAADAAPPIDADALTALVDALSLDQLRTAMELLSAEHPPAGAAALRLALLARHVGRDDVALEQVRGQDLGAYADRGDELVEEVRARRAADARVVAVLVPRSGPLRSLGAEVADAVRLAAADVEGLRLVFLDTGADPERARAAVDEAVYRHRAVGLLGPVGVAASAAAATRAATLRIPIALLSADAAPAPAAGVFRFWTGGDDLARSVADLAIERGFDRFGVLWPRDEVGQAQAAAFAQRVHDRGRAVVAAGDYDPSGTDLEPDLRDFLRLDPRANRRLRDHLRRARTVRDGYVTFSPDVAFDAVFVPDDYRRAALVVAYLPYFNVELRRGLATDYDTLRKKHGGRIPQVVQLLGAAGWHHPGLFARGGDAVEGALVVDVWGGEWQSGVAARFAEAFVDATGREPSPAAAQAYDAAALFFAARERVDPRRGDPRAALRASLSAARIADGACGQAEVGANGAVERDAILFEVDRGEFVPDP